jgi:hypothetical protein
MFPVCSFTSKRRIKQAGAVEGARGSGRKERGGDMYTDIYPFLANPVQGKYFLNQKGNICCYKHFVKSKNTIA